MLRHCRVINRTEHVGRLSQSGNTRSQAFRINLGRGDTESARIGQSESATIVAAVSAICLRDPFRMANVSVAYAVKYSLDHASKPGSLGRRVASSRLLHRTLDRLLPARAGRSVAGPLDNAGGGMARHQVDQNHLPAVSLDELMAHHGLLAIIAALDEHARLKPP